MTGLAMRTLLSAYRGACVAAELCWTWTSVLDDAQVDWLHYKKGQQADRFYAALLAKIDASEAQMKADAERIAELEEVESLAVGYRKACRELGGCYNEAHQGNVNALAWLPTCRQVESDAEDALVDMLDALIGDAWPGRVW